MNTEHKASCIITESPDLQSLGLAVRVYYIRPTDHKGGRWKAVVDEGNGQRVSAIVQNDFGSSDEGSRLAAAKKALGKWVGTFETHAPSSVEITAKGFDGSSYFFFFACNR